MRIDVKECARLLLEQDDILILTHAHPDGDTLGSVSYTHLTLPTT